ncbi:MAG: SDR family NAD(P)-dependent oxidoreductase [Geminicoccaceae bacterium]
MAAQEATTLAALHLVQALARREALAPRLYLATRGAHLLPVERQPGISALRLARAPLVGFVRTAANEQPQLRLTLVDLDPESLHNGEGAAADLMAEILADSPELEVALRGEHRYVNRVDAVPAETLPRRQVSAAALGANRDYRLTMPAPGVFDNMFVTETDRVEPAAGQAVVAVRAVGLNFRDVLAAADLLPEGAEDVEGWRTLGIEYAGVVRAVAPDVTTLAPGDRVMGSAKACLGSAIAVPAASLQPIPDSLDFTAAATLPAAFMTAHLALNELGRMAEGDKVLIHVATGGVGLAAIQLARLKGCEIFATAGTDEKRAYLRSLGIRHVMNSRTLDFADEIMAATNGTGVDLVLNSLPGPFIDKGLGVLAPYGRFLEIGKRDLFADKPVGLASLKNSNAFITINLEAMGRERPAEVRRVFTDVATMLAEGQIGPLPTTTFPLASAAEAFRFMSQARHIGKVVIEVDESELQVALDPDRPLTLATDGAYLVTGGLAGFGLEVARSLGRAGAGQLVLMSRSGAASDEAKAAVAELEAAGTEVTVVAGDVTQLADVERAVAAAGAGGRRLKGVVHAAMVLDDGFITQLDRDRFATALAPKMVGGWNLHRATQGQELDFFVLFSSVAALLGSTGQANYVAGNAFLDKLATFRRAAGLPGISLAWGALGGKGFVARNAAIQSYLESQGIVPLEIDEALAAFGRVVRLDPGAVALAKVDWAKLGKAQTVVSGSPRVAHLLAQGEDGKAAGGRARAAILAAPPARRPALLAKFLKEQVGRVLRVEPAEIDADRPLSELGLDSLTSFEFKNRIETELGVSLPAGKFLQKPTISGLTQAIAENLSEAVVEDAAEPAAETDDAALPLTAWQDWVMRIEGEAPRAQAVRGMNHLAAAMSVSPPVEADRLARAVEAAIARHTGLRLVLVDGPAGREARVVDEPGWGLAISDHRTLDDDAFAALLAAKRDEPYDLARGPMIRIELIHRSDDTDVILLCAHHAILDGWSLMLLFNEMFVDYVGLELDDDGGKRFDAVDFARWQRHFMASDEGRQQLEHWLGRLRDLGPPLPLPYDRQPGAGGKLDLRHGDFIRMELPRRLADRVAKVAQDAGTSRYVVLLAAFEAYLSHLTARTDLLVTASVAGRTRPELEQVIGAVRNYVAIRSAIDPRSRFADLVRATADTVADALAHQDYPGFEVFERVEPGYSGKRTIVDQVGFQMLRPTNLDDRGFGQLMLYEGGRKASFGSIEAETLTIEERGCYRELTFYEVEHEGNIYLLIHYDTDLFTAASAKRMLESYILMLERAIMEPAVRLSDLLTADASAAALEAGER